MPSHCDDTVPMLGTPVPRLPLASSAPRYSATGMSKDALRTRQIQRTVAQTTLTTSSTSRTNGSYQTPAGDGRLHRGTLPEVGRSSAVEGFVRLPSGSLVPIYTASRTPNSSQPDFQMPSSRSTEAFADTDLKRSILDLRGEVRELKANIRSLTSSVDVLVLSTENQQLKSHIESLLSGDHRIQPTSTLQNHTPSPIGQFAFKPNPPWNSLSASAQRSIRIAVRRKQIKVKLAKQNNVPCTASSKPRSPRITQKNKKICEEKPFGRISIRDVYHKNAIWRNKNASQCDYIRFEEDPDICAQFVCSFVSDVRQPSSGDNSLVRQAATSREYSDENLNNEKDINNEETKIETSHDKSSGEAATVADEIEASGPSAQEQGLNRTEDNVATRTGSLERHEATEKTRANEKDKLLAQERRESPNEFPNHDNGMPSDASTHTKAIIEPGQTLEKLEEELTKYCKAQEVMSEADTQLRSVDSTCPFAATDAKLRAEPEPLMEEIGTKHQEDSTNFDVRTSLDATSTYAREITTSKGVQPDAQELVAYQTEVQNDLAGDLATPSYDFSFSLKKTEETEAPSKEMIERHEHEVETDSDAVNKTGTLATVCAEKKEKFDSPANNESLSKENGTKQREVRNDPSNIEISSNGITHSLERKEDFDAQTDASSVASWLNSATSTESLAEKDDLSSNNNLPELFRQRVKLYARESGKWKERGKGELQIIKDVLTGLSRVSMRDAKDQRILVDHEIGKSMKLSPMKTSGNSWCWVTPETKHVSREEFAACFKSKEAKELFKSVVGKCKQNCQKSSSKLKANNNADSNAGMENDSTAEDDVTDTTNYFALTRTDATIRPNKPDKELEKAPEQEPITKPIAQKTGSDTTDDGRTEVDTSSPIVTKPAETKTDKEPEKAAEPEPAAKPFASFSFQRFKPAFGSLSFGTPKVSDTATSSTTTPSTISSSFVSAGASDSTFQKTRTGSIFGAGAGGFSLGGVPITKPATTVLSFGRASPSKPATTGFSFGRASPSKPAATGFSLGGASTSKAATTGFSFGSASPSKPAATGFSLGGASTSKAATRGFSLGCGLTSKPATTGLSLGGGSTSKPAATGFSLGGALTSKPAATGFSLGGASTSKAATTGFSLGGGLTSKPATTGLSLGGGSTSKPAATGFSFGGALTSKPATTGFSFGRASTSKPAATGFSFGGALTSKPATTGFSFGGVSTSQPSGKESKLSGPDFKPLVNLPEVEVKSGEEDEDTLFNNRAKLFRFSEGQWKERGLGMMKILQHKETKTTRILMRREQVLKVCANHRIKPDMLIEYKDAEKKTLTWGAMDHSEEAAHMEQFCCKFKTPEVANEFREVFEKAKKIAGACPFSSIQASPNPYLQGISPVSFSSLAATPTDRQKPAFGVDKKPFAGSGSPVFKASPAKGSAEAKEEEDERKVEDYEPDVDFKPIVTLPEKVDLMTGEEGEEKLFGHRAKLYRHDAEAKQWKERGTGEIKIMRNAESGTSRVLMRREQVHKICANHLITKDMKLAPLQTSENAWCWFAHDYTEEEMKLEQLAVRFKSKDTAHQFKTVFEECVQSASTDAPPKLDDHIYFEPVVKLPDNVVVKTGEEDEDLLYCHRAKLYRFSDGEWKERGIGNVKILRNKQTEKCRILMRREHVLKICLNHSLTADLKLNPRAYSKGKAWVCYCIDFAEEQESHEQLAIRFVSEEVANNFKTHFETAISDPKSLPVIHHVEDKSPEKKSKPRSDSYRKKSEFKEPEEKTNGKSDTCTSFSFKSPEADKGAAAAASSTPKPAAAGFTFGGTSTSKPTDAGFVFGSPSSTKTSGSIFGNSQSSPFTSGTSVFGGSSKPEDSTSKPGLLARLLSEPGKDGDAPLNLSMGPTLDPDILEIRDEVIPKDKQTEAQKWRLPPAFYSYESRPPCEGCIGCQSDEFDFGTIGKAKDTSAPAEKTVLNPDDRVHESSPRVRFEPPSGDDVYNHFGHVTRTRHQCITAMEEYQAESIEELRSEDYKANRGPPKRPTSHFGEQAQEQKHLSTKSSDLLPSGFESTEDHVSVAVNSGEGFAVFKKTDSTSTSVFGSSSGGSSFDDFASLAAKSGDGFAFGKKTDSTKPFSFAGSGAAVFGSKSPSTPRGAGAEDEDADEVEESPDVHFEPIVQLPEVVDLKTGEEDDEKLFSHRCKLYRYDGDQWKERALGEMKILRNKETGRCRLLMRREQVLKVACNHMVTADMTLQPLHTSETAWCWYAVDYAENQPQNEQFAVRFKTIELAKAFKAKFDEVRDAAAKDTTLTPEEPTPTAPSTAAEDVSEQTTEEEEEEDGDQVTVLFTKRATLFYVKQDGSFESAGMGDLRVSYDEDVFGARINLITDQETTACNHIICRKYRLKTDPKKKTCEWQAKDFSTDEPIRRHFRAQFSSAASVEEFKDVFDQGLEWAVESEIDEVVDGASLTGELYTK